MSKQKLISEAMTALPHTVGADQTLQTAKELMKKYSVRHLPVQSAGTLVGVLSERDIEFAIAAERKDAEEIIVEDACSPNPYIVAPSVDLATVASQLERDRIGCALVADANGIVGIFTTVDACRALAELLKETS